jgi:signal transduction histidine kinase
VIKPSPLLRPVALVVVVVMAGISALGFHSIRKDIENLQVISRDNILWSATQMEVELLRFQRSLAYYATEPSEAALDDVHARFDILWSRFDLMTQGRVGQLLRQYDEGHGTLQTVSAYLREIDPFILALAPEIVNGVQPILQDLDALQSDMRLYSLRVVRGDTAAASMVGDRMRASAQLTASIALGALVISLLTLFLIMRDNRRQREMAAMSQRQAEAAEAASQAKSRFLTMMSHELRNPLNGVLGPIALIGQSEIGERQMRLLERAKQSGRIMLRMLRGLLDYGDMQDGRLVLREEVFRPRALAEEVGVALRDASADTEARVTVTVGRDMPDMVWGDMDRMTQIFVYLAEYVIGSGRSTEVEVAFSHEDEHLVGRIAFADGDAVPGWKLDLLMGLSGDMRRPFASDALAPLIARGLLGTVRGLLALAEDEAGRRVIRVAVPARRVAFEKIRIHLETRSAALETLYRVALKSDRVDFLDPAAADPADVVLVDSTSIGDSALIRSLRERFPDALFVSIGLPASPAYFDEIVDAPNDMARLRESVLGRLAS